MTEIFGSNPAFQSYVGQVVFSSNPNNVNLVNEPPPPPPPSPPTPPPPPPPPLRPPPPPHPPSPPPHPASHPPPPISPPPPPGFNCGTPNCDGHGTAAEGGCSCTCDAGWSTLTNQDLAHYVWCSKASPTSPGTASIAGSSPAPSNSTITNIETRAKSLLGLDWQYWAAILSGLGGVLLLFYCTKNCCPCWSWTKTAVRLAWLMLKCCCKCGWCMVKMLPRSDSPEAIRKEELKNARARHKREEEREKRRQHEELQRIREAEAQRKHEAALAAIDGAPAEKLISALQPSDAAPGREDGNGSASAGRKSEGRGLFATVVSSAAAKGRKLSVVKGRIARVSATEPLTQQSTLSTALTADAGRSQQAAAPNPADYNFAAALNSLVPQPSVELQAVRVAQLAQEMLQKQQQEALYNMASQLSAAAQLRSAQTLHFGQMLGQPTQFGMPGGMSAIQQASLQTLLAAQGQSLYAGAPLSMPALQPQQQSQAMARLVQLTSQGVPGPAMAAPTLQAMPASSDASGQACKAPAPQSMG